ncbi:hypothetical protein WA026_002853 [Henosepilachna vigintioctopunctata]|uniref:Uncharacterized protein n=1 Tax=Henosepilachna vigintioctopunctata TaxID=420089 RepID=A0AAW1U2J2_9CUCU
MKDFARLLIKYGADLKSINEEGETPVHTAVNANCGLMADVLLKEGADMSIRDNMGYTPVTKAFSAPLRSADILRNLGNHLIMQHECKFQVDLDILHYIIDYDGFMNFQINCADELLKLKQKKIHNYNITYPHEVAKCLGNDDILQDLIILDESKYNFGNRIIRNFKKGMRRHKAAQKLREIFNVVLPFLPSVCIDRILENLDSRNIEQLEKYRVSQNDPTTLVGKKIQ